MHSRPSADHGQSHEAREEDEPEAGHREQRPTGARRAERDRQADRAEKAVGRTEAAPGDHREHDQQHEERERLQVDRRCAHRVGVLNGRPVDVGVRARGELLDAGPGRAQPIPDPTERTRIREVAVPEALRPGEGQRVAAGSREVEGVRGEDERRDAQAEERTPPVRPPPGHDHERREQRDPGDAREHGQAGHQAGADPATALGEQERADRECEEQRLGVDGAEEQCHREYGEVEDRAAGAVRAEARFGQPVEEDEGGERRGQRDDDPCGDVVPAEDTADPGESERVEGVERGGHAVRLAVAVYGDAEEPDAVPSRPHVGHPAEVAGQGGVVPPGGVRMPVRLEDQPGEQRACPDRRAAPEEDPDRRPPDHRHAQLGEPCADAGPASDPLDLGRSTHAARSYFWLVERIFTPGEANELLPTVRPLVERMVEGKRALDTAQEQADEVSVRISGNGGGLPPARLAEVSAEVNRRATELARTVEEIQALGVVVKDLDSGLVDFPSVREGEDVLLCWRLGEDEVAFWHGYDDGFAGRRPI